MIKCFTARIAAACFGLLVWTGVAAANCPTTLPYTLSNGTTADASQVMANFNSLQACANLVGVKVFTTSGTYTCDAGTSKVIIEVQGGGGAGGGSGASTSSTGSFGGGGSAGAYYKGLATSNFCGATVTVGATATGVAGANGPNGVAASFVVSGGVNITAGGGQGGLVGAVVASGANGNTLGGVVTASGATTIMSVNGMGGGWSAWSSTFGVTGAGGSSPLGIGGLQEAIAVGLPFQQGGAYGIGYGCGGGGAFSFLQSSGGATQSGGNGCPGLVVVWEY